MWVFLFVCLVNAQNAGLDRALHSVALVTLAVGPRARSFTTTLIQSYIRNADTDAPLYIVTEDATYFQAAIEAMKARFASQAARLDVEDDDDDDATADASSYSILLRATSLVRFIAVSADLVESDDPEVRQRQKLQRTASNTGATDGLANNVHMRVKLLKTELLQMLPTQFEYALYLDSDMVIGQALKPFLTQAIQSMLDVTIRPRDVDNPHVPNKKTVLALFRDVGISGAPYHTGVMFMSRKKSRRLFEEWAAEMLTGKYTRDQHALAATVRRTRQTEFMHLLPTDGPGTRFFSFVSGNLFRSMQPYTFVHATVYRLTQPDRFGFTHEQARTYYRQVLRADYLYDFLDDNIKHLLEQQEVKKPAAASHGKPKLHHKPKPKPQPHQHHDAL